MSRWCFECCIDIMSKMVRVVNEVWVVVLGLSMLIIWEMKKHFWKQGWMIGYVCERGHLCEYAVYVLVD